MKYVITGSTGHISKPLTETLVKAGHEVNVVTSRDNKKAEIESLGAKAAIGSVEDRDFLTKTFTGADALYLMIPPPADDVTDWLGHQKKVADNYIAAAKAAKTKHIVILSSIGADLRHGVGPVDGLGYLEEQVPQLTDAAVVMLRPSSFYYNLFAQIGMIKHMGSMAGTQPGDFNVILTHPTDIAAAAAEHLLSLNFAGHQIQYVASDDSRTWNDIAKVLGQAIGKPELKYTEITDEQSKQGMLGAGMNPEVVKEYVNMGQSLRSGNMQREYYTHKPAKLGKVKLEDFSKEFAGAFNAGK